MAWEKEDPGTEFRANEHYFVVRVNELYLSFSREWFATYDPMVLVVSEFTYDKQEHAVPFVVGPNLLESRGQEAPAGMVFSDTRVAGLHPYRGGRLTLSVVLSRVQRENYAKEFLKMVESAAGVLDFSTALSMYVKVASVVLDGVSALLGMDGGATPVIGYRKEFDPDVGDDLSPSYFALIDLPEEELEPLWIREHSLYAGTSLEESVPFRKADFVLYSIRQSEKRSDERTLPFYPLFERVQESATSQTPADRKRAKGDMASLWQTLILSPDLTSTQARALGRQYRATLEELLEEASTLGPGDPKQSDETVAALREAAEILDI